MKMDFIPKEIHIFIFSLLDGIDLKNVALVCKQWTILVSDKQSIFKNIFIINY